MFNVSMDLDMANGARGHIVDIVLDEREEDGGERTDCMRLQYPPLYVLVAMNRTKASALPELEHGVLPVAPLHQQIHKNLPEHHRFCNIPTIVHSFSQHPRSLQKVPVLQVNSPEHHRSPRMLQFHRNN